MTTDLYQLHDTQFFSYYNERVCCLTFHAYLAPNLRAIPVCSTPKKSEKEESCTLCMCVHKNRTGTGNVVNWGKMRGVQWIGVGLCVRVCVNLVDTTPPKRLEPALDAAAVGASFDHLIFSPIYPVQTTVQYNCYVTLKRVYK